MKNIIEMVTGKQKKMAEKQEAQKKIALLCGAEIEAVLKKYNMKLQVVQQTALVPNENSN